MLTYAENSPNRAIKQMETAGSLCTECSPDMDKNADCEDCVLGACCVGSTCLQYESVDRGKVCTRSLRPHTH